MIANLSTLLSVFRLLLIDLISRNATQICTGRKEGLRNGDLTTCKLSALTGLEKIANTTFISNRRKVMTIKGMEAWQDSIWPLTSDLPPSTSDWIIYLYVYVCICVYIYIYIRICVCMFMEFPAVSNYPHHSHPASCSLVYYHWLAHSCDCCLNNLSVFSCAFKPRYISRDWV